MGGLGKIYFLMLSGIAVIDVTASSIAQRGGEYPLVGDTAGHQQNPSVSVTSKGGLVAWQNATADSGGERIVIQSLGPDYRGVGAPRVVSQNITGQNDLNPSISVLPEDRYAVV